MATIMDVAERAGVSVATVSRVFNGAKVSQQRTDAVLKAAEELSFVPNRAARNFRMKKSDLIALIIPDLSNPFFTELARGVEDRVSKDGYSMVLCNTDDSKEKELKYLEIVSAQEMAGMMMVVADTDDPPSELRRMKSPVVAVDRAPELPIDSVISANVVAGRQAAKALLDLGYSSIAYIGGPDYIDASVRRLEGWSQAMKELASVDVPDRLTISTNFKVDGGYEAAKELLEQEERPDAIVAANSLTAVGVLRALTEEHILPPTIGVAVIGSLPYSTLSLKNVVTIELNEYEVGWRGAEMLLERIGGYSGPPRAVVVDVEVAQRRPR